MVAIIYELCSCIMKRYDYVNDLLIAVFDIPEERVDVEIELHGIKRMYIILHDTVKHFNAIFGMFGIYFFTNYLLTVLIIVELLIGDQPLEGIYKWMFTAYLIIQNVSLIASPYGK
ncbi:hypothetical protein JTB14_029259 [Gonioctena quinquepunctata]|nr:hypothetical protein JTB14_029259 [Gonioctena quinquepunctata]